MGEWSQLAGNVLHHAWVPLFDFAYFGPGFINPFTIYSVALPKVQAHCQLNSFGREIGLGPAIANTESWKVVTALGQD